MQHNGICQVDETWVEGSVLLLLGVPASIPALPYASEPNVFAVAHAQAHPAFGEMTWSGPIYRKDGFQRTAAVSNS